MSKNITTAICVLYMLVLITALVIFSRSEYAMNISREKYTFIFGCIWVGWSVITILISFAIFKRLKKKQEKGIEYEDDVDYFKQVYIVVSVGGFLITLFTFMIISYYFKQKNTVNYRRISSTRSPSRSSVVDIQGQPIVVEQPVFKRPDILESPYVRLAGTGNPNQFVNLENAPPHVKEYMKLNRIEREGRQRLYSVNPIGFLGEDKKITESPKKIFNRSEIEQLEKTGNIFGLPAEQASPKTIRSMNQKNNPTLARKQNAILPENFFSPEEMKKRRAQFGSPEFVTTGNLNTQAISEQQIPVYNTYFDKEVDRKSSLEKRQHDAALSKLSQRSKKQEKNFFSNLFNS